MDQSNAARYRAEAERLRQAAKATRNEELRREYLNIATEYERLAASVERPSFKRREHSN